MLISAVKAPCARAAPRNAAAGYTTDEVPAAMKTSHAIASWACRTSTGSSDSPNQTTAGLARAPQCGQQGSVSGSGTRSSRQRRGAFAQPDQHDSSQMESVKPHEAPCASQQVKVVDVLGQNLPFGRSPAPRGEDVVGGVRPTSGQLLAPPPVPLPHEPRIAFERLRRCEFFGAVASPQPILSAERGHPARSRDTGSREHGHSASGAQSCRQLLHEIVHATVEYDRAARLCLVSA